MKKTILFLLAFVPLLLSGQDLDTPVFDWAVQMGGDDSDKGRGITTDHLGNVFVTGEFSNTADFDPGPDEYILTSAGNTDAFVAKYAPDGQLIWAHAIGDTLADTGAGISIDSLGNIYVVGHALGAVDFDPGQDTAYLPVGQAFILKLNNAGDFIWVKRLAGAFNVSVGKPIAVSQNGDIHLTGLFSGTSDFDPDSAVYNLSSINASSDIFILKLNSDGDFVWAKAIGSEERDGGFSIALDSANNVYTTGYFRADADFDPGPDEFILNACGGIWENDAFIVKLNSNGDFEWAKSIGNCGDSVTSAGIAVNEGGEVFTTGKFEGTLDFDPGSGEYELSTLWWDAIDIFILKLSTEGDFVWAKNVGSWNWDRGHTITLDKENNIYTAGNFNGSVDFDPSSDTFNITSEETDIFILKLDSEGDFVWAGGLIGTGGGTLGIGVSGYAITVDSFDNIYSTGSFTQTTDFNPSNENHELTSNGALDVFLHKMSQQVCSSIPVISTSEDLTVCAHDEFILEADGGIAYLWNTGDSTNVVEITATGDQAYFVTVTDSDGCTAIDSVIVSVNLLSDTTYLEFTSCDTALVGSTILTYFDQNSCDSIVIESTTLIPTPEMPTAPADMIIPENAPPFPLTIVEVPNATEYIWTVPAAVQIISGQGTNTITIDWGNTITSGPVCVSAINECGNSMADCMEVEVDIVDGINNTITENRFSVFPNPAAEVVNIIFEKEENYELELFDAFGRQIISKKKFHGQSTIDVKSIPSGMYWLKLVVIGEKTKPLFMKVEVAK